MMIMLCRLNSRVFFGHQNNSCNWYYSSSSISISSDGKPILFYYFSSSRSKTCFTGMAKARMPNECDCSKQIRTSEKCCSHFNHIVIIPSLSQIKLLCILRPQMILNITLSVIHVYWSRAERKKTSRSWVGKWDRRKNNDNGSYESEVLRVFSQKDEAVGPNLKVEAVISTIYQRIIQKIDLSPEWNEVRWKLAKSNNLYWSFKIVR